MPVEVVCIGAAHWDIVARAAAQPEPGDDLPGRIVRRPGGVALNMALGLARAGIATELLSALGRDAEGDALLALAARTGVATRRVARDAGPTGGYLAIEAPGGPLFAAVADCASLEAAGAGLVAALAAEPPPPVVVADGNLDAGALTRLLALAGSRLVLVPASPAKAAALRPALARGRATLVMNRREAETLLNRPLRDAKIAAAALCAAGAHEAVVTDGPNPATRTGPAGTVTLAPPATAGSATGAGDAFAAALVAADVSGLAPDAALAQALAAATRHLEANP